MVPCFWHAGTLVYNLYAIHQTEVDAARYIAKENKSLQVHYTARCGPHVCRHLLVLQAVLLRLAHVIFRAAQVCQLQQGQIQADASCSSGLICCDSSCAAALGVSSLLVCYTDNTCMLWCQ